MSPVKLFHKYRGLNDFTLATLLSAVKSLLPRLVGQQTRHKVTDMPSERTIRFYISRGLVDKPLGKRGTASLFGYRHLIQILTIKYLQYQYLPLRKIRSLMAGRSNRELERLLPEGTTSSPPPPGRILKEPGGRAAVDGPSEGGETAEKPRTLRLSRHSPPGESWRHYPIAPGVEVHLREDASPPRDDGEFDRWMDRIRLILARIPGDGGEGDRST